MIPRIKWCGFTRAEDVVFACGLGVDLIGLNLAKGPRKITLDHAVALSRLIPPGIGVVALFVNAPMADIDAALSAIRPAAVQLHGQEAPEYAAEIAQRVPVIKAFSVRDADSLAAIRGYPADAYLLDAAVPGLEGGSGQGWDHHLLIGQDLGRPIFLAGGLRPENVADAIAGLRPWAVDAASGIESAPGVKDTGRMHACMDASVRRQYLKGPLQVHA